MAEAEAILGACLCGAVRFRVRGPWLRFVHCHCSRCRRATGTGHATNLFAAGDHLQWLAGESRVVRYDLPAANGFATAFCSTCGSPQPHRVLDGRVWLVPAGSFAGEPSATPSSHIFWSSRSGWSCDGDGLPRYETRPEA